MLMLAIAEEDISAGATLEVLVDELTGAARVRAVRVRAVRVRAVRVGVEEVRRSEAARGAHLDPLSPVAEAEALEEERVVEAQTPADRPPGWGRT